MKNLGKFTILILLTIISSCSSPSISEEKLKTDLIGKDISENKEYPEVIDQNKIKILDILINDSESEDKNIVITKSLILINHNSGDANPLIVGHANVYDYNIVYLGTTTHKKNKDDWELVSQTITPILGRYSDYKFPNEKEIFETKKIGKLTFTAKPINILTLDEEALNQSYSSRNMDCITTEECKKYEKEENYDYRSFGQLYNYSDVSDFKYSVIPTGWRLPTIEDVLYLLKQYDNDFNQIRKDFSLPNYFYRDDYNKDDEGFGLWVDDNLMIFNEPLLIFQENSSDRPVFDDIDDEVYFPLILVKEGNSIEEGDVKIDKEYIRKFNKGQL